jgi:hypothetical protein
MTRKIAVVLVTVMVIAALTIGGFALLGLILFSFNPTH